MLENKTSSKDLPKREEEGDQEKLPGETDH